MLTLANITSQIGVVVFDFSISHIFFSTFIFFSLNGVFSPPYTVTSASYYQFQDQPVTKSTVCVVHLCHMSHVYNSYCQYYTTRMYGTIYSPVRRVSLITSQPAVVFHFGLFTYLILFSLLSYIILLPLYYCGVCPFRSRFPIPC